VRLRGLVFVVGVAGGSAVGEEDEAPQVVERLAAIELPPDSPAERFVGEPAQGVKRPQETPSVRNRRARSRATSAASRYVEPAPTATSASALPRATNWYLRAA